MGFGESGFGESGFCEWGLNHCTVIRVAASTRVLEYYSSSKLLE